MPQSHTQASSTAATSRVLVVDDDDAVRMFVKRILDEEGYVVDASATGPDALTRIQDGQVYDLIVADVCMPEMSGPQLIARMRQRGSDAKVLYVTGFADQLFDERDEQLWADEAFLDKPCTVQGLREAVSLLLRGQIESASLPRTLRRIRRVE
jgi:two-component system, cell cycle sensor histidine kinase and response regulator CckA